MTTSQQAINRRHRRYDRMYVDDLLDMFQRQPELVLESVCDSARGHVHLVVMFTVIATNFHLFNLEEIPGFTRYEAFSNVMVALLYAHRLEEASFMMDNASVFGIAGHRALVDQLKTLLSLYPRQKPFVTPPVYPLVNRVVESLKPFFKNTGRGAMVAMKLECVQAGMDNFFCYWLIHKDHTPEWTASAIKVMNLLEDTNPVVFNKVLVKVGWYRACRFGLNGYQLLLAEAILDADPAIVLDPVNMASAIASHNYHLVWLLMLKGASPAMAMRPVVLGQGIPLLERIAIEIKHISIFNPGQRPERKVQLKMMIRLIRKVAVFLPLVQGNQCQRLHCRLRVLPTDILRKLTGYLDFSL